MEQKVWGIAKKRLLIRVTRGRMLWRAMINCLHSKVKTLQKLKSATLKLVYQKEKVTNMFILYTLSLPFFFLISKGHVYFVFIVAFKKITFLGTIKKTSKWVVYRTIHSMINVRFHWNFSRLNCYENMLISFVSILLHVIY